MEFSKKIHVTLIGGGKFSTLGGIVRSIVEIANHLAEHGHAVKILANGIETDTPFYPVHADVEVEFVKYPFNVRRIDDFRNILKQQKTDLFVLCFSNKIGFNVSAAAYGLDVPILRSEHGNPDHLIENIWNGNPQMREMMFKMADYSHVLLESFSQIPALPHSVTSYIKHIPSPIKLNVKLARPGAKSVKPKRIIYCGRIESFEKDTQALLDAFLSIADEFKDWSLDFFGDGGLRADLEALVPKKLQDRILFHGAIPPEQLSQELSKSHIFVIPSDTEGCPMSLGEAMAHGLPALGFKSCRGVNAFIKHSKTGFLCEEGKAFRGEGLIEPLKTLMSDSTLRTRFGAMAVKEISALDSKLVLEDWRKACEETASIGSHLEDFRAKKRSSFPDMEGLEARLSFTIDYVKKHKSFPAQGIIPKPKTDESEKSTNEQICNKPLPDDHILVSESVPFITVIVPVFNMAAYAEDTVKSVMSQSLKNIEILVINDGSTDKSISILRNIEKQDNRIRVIDQDNLGVSATRNRGLREAKGKYVLFWDGDDLLLPDALEKLFVEGEVNDSEIVTGGLYHFQSNNHRVREWTIPRYALLMREKEDQTDIFKSDRLRYDVSTCNKLYNREFLIHNEIFYPEGLRLEDILFSWQAYLSASKVCISTVEVGGYRKVQNSRKGSSLWGEQKVDSVVEVYNRLTSMISAKGKDIASDLSIDVDIYFSYVVFYAIKAVVHMDARKRAVQERRLRLRDVLKGINPEVIASLPIEYQRKFAAFLKNPKITKTAFSKLNVAMPVQKDSVSIEFSKIRKVKLFDTLEFVSKRLPRGGGDLVDYYTEQSLRMVDSSLD